MTPPIRFYLDADLSPRIVVIARGLGGGLDVVSAHEVGMAEADDDHQLARAAGEGRGLVTRTRDDFVTLPLAAYQERAPHAGLLLVPPSSASHQAARLARALRRWTAGPLAPVPNAVNRLRG